MAALRFEDTPKVAQQAAALLLQGAIRKLYHTLTGEEPRGDPVRLLERLLAQDRLTPDAALYLLSFARAIGTVGRGSGTAAAVDGWRDRLEAVGQRVASRLVRAALER